MRIGPRQELLDVWRAVAAERMAVPGQWHWGGAEERNCIHDAEQLLCVMSPATALPRFELDRPDSMAPDLEEALAPIGSVVEIPRRLADAALDYLETYRNEHGEPTFAAGSRLGAEASAAQRGLETVEAYAISVRLTLAIIGLARVFRTSVTRAALLHQLDHLQELAGQRLAAALVGLTRCYTINVFAPDSRAGVTLLTLLNQSRIATRRVHDDLTRRLQDIRAALRDSTLEDTQPPDFDNYYKLFECGWSWGVLHDAPPVETYLSRIAQPQGVAGDEASLWATAVALDGMQELWSERTRLLGLLDAEQQRLANALQLRWDITQNYWSRLARFDDRRWPLEDLPWRTNGGIESDYLSLQVCSVVIQDLQRRPDPEAARRVALVLQELAERARMTRRPAPREAVTLHHPGYPLELPGSEEADGPRLVVELTDFAAQLLKQAVLVAQITRDIDGRHTVLDLVDRVWAEHIAPRRLRPGVWDRPDAVFPDLDATERQTQPSWTFTERVVGALVSAAQLVDSPPLRSPGLRATASDLLAEADHLYDQELMRINRYAGPALNELLRAIRARLQQARELLDELPGTAVALASAALDELAHLRSARRDAMDR